MLNYVRRRKTLDDATAGYILRELCLGVGYIHSRGIVHRDIKLENILLENTGQIKLCDFGVSTMVPIDGTYLTECTGTPIYMAPEVVECDAKLLRENNDAPKKKRNEGYRFSCDVWSLGVVLFALLYGNFPFQGVSVTDVKLDILNIEPLIKDTISKDGQSIVREML